MKAKFGKQLLIPLILVVTVGATIGVKALNNSAVLPLKKVATVQSEQPKPETNTTSPTVTSPEVAPVPTTSTIATPEDTQPVPKTEDELKAEASQLITATDRGSQSYEYMCFDLIVNRYYGGWTLSESEMLKRITNIKSMYTDFCSAWSVVKVYPTLAQIQQNPNVLPPPGFRD